MEFAGVSCLLIVRVLTVLVGIAQFVFLNKTKPTKSGKVAGTGTEPIAWSSLQQCSQQVQFTRVLRVFFSQGLRETTAEASLLLTSTSSCVGRDFAGDRNWLI